LEKRFKILVVDDDSTLREAIAGLLSKHFYVSKAASGNEAIEFLKSNSMDIVITDVRMPQGTGVDLLNWVRSVDPEFPVVVFISGFTDVTEDAAIKNGAFTILNKPFKSKSLFEVIDQIISKIISHRPT
jgi:DNA-binding NtrC family response regulator